MVRQFSVAALALVMPVLVAACTVDGPAQPDHHETGEGPLGMVRSAVSDADPLSTVDSCTTSVVAKLSTQLIEEIQCLRPGTFATVEGAQGFTLGSAVFPWLQTPAKQALLDAQKQRGTTMVINSALRTLPQQYLLYHWYKTGRCGISLAASPGKSNHESGLAVDVEDSDGWRPAMSEYGFTWLGASDPVHFDYTGDGKVDIGGVSVLAFQRLWNRNHPEDVIDEDSAYGPSTEERLAKSPVGGFEKGADCGPAKPSDPPPSSSTSGSGGGLGPSGDRHEGEGQGCTLTRRPTNDPTWLPVLAFATALVVTARRSARR